MHLVKFPYYEGYHASNSLPNVEWVYLPSSMKYEIFFSKISVVSIYYW